jgi:iron transport multicopper oxidase
LNPNVTGWLIYDDSKPKPEAKAIDSFDAQFDDFALVPYDKEALYSNVDQSITLDMKMDNLNDGANYAFFNDITYVAPKVPTLYTVLSTGANATNPIIYGQNTNAFVLAQNQVVEIILNNDDPGKHPFHLHGHAFQVVARSEEEAGAFASRMAHGLRSRHHYCRGPFSSPSAAWWQDPARPLGHVQGRKCAYCR